MSELMPQSEVIDIRLHRARSWCKKAKDATDDLDAQFIFLSIAFNALYGNPRYLRPREESAYGEVKDFTTFLEQVDRLSGGGISARIQQLDASRRLLRSPYLNIDCWKMWDREGIRDRRRRETSVGITFNERHWPSRVFRQIYTLRNQVLHGAATNKSRLAGESLKLAVPVLETIVPMCINIVQHYGGKILGLEQLPFPPSVGDKEPFNSMRTKQTR